MNDSHQQIASRLGVLPQAKVNWYDSPWRIAIRAIGSALAIIIVSLVLAVAVVPRVLGGDSLTVLTGSMEPVLSPGDLVAVKGIDESAVCTDIGIGNIVTYFPTPNDPALITHRVVGKTIGTFDDGTSCRLITQGDANSADDGAISPAQVRGVFMYGIPKIGWARQWVASNVPLVVVALGIGVLIWGLWSTFRRPRRTVITIPGSADLHNEEDRAEPLPADTSAAAAGHSASSHAGPDTATLQRELDLRERELELRAREIELREREFEYSTKSEVAPKHAGAGAGAVADEDVQRESVAPVSETRQTEDVPKMLEDPSDEIFTDDFLNRLFEQESHPSEETEGRQ